MKQELHNDCDGGQCVACAREAEEGFDELQFVKDQCTTLSNALHAERSELRLKNQQIEAMAEQMIGQQKQIETLQGAFGNMAATIRQLTEERIGPEKPLYQQLQDRGMVAALDRGHVFSAEGICHVCGCRAAEIGNFPPCDPVSGD